MAVAFRNPSIRLLCDLTGDKPYLSEQPEVIEPLQRSGLFKSIFVEAVDFIVPGVDTSVKGFDMQYTLGRERQFLEVGYGLSHR